MGGVSKRGGRLEALAHIQTVPYPQQSTIFSSTLVARLSFTFLLQISLLLSLNYQILPYPRMRFGALPALAVLSASIGKSHPSSLVRPLPQILLPKPSHFHHATHRTPANTPTAIRSRRQPYQGRRDRSLLHRSTLWSCHRRHRRSPLHRPPHRVTERPSGQQ